MSLSFEKHLESPDNHRIIFSAKYGEGKTYFLKNIFFSSEENQKKYETVHLFPVNYAVASNEDIFELIKRDIIINLIQTDRFQSDSLLETLKNHYSFLSNNIEELLNIGLGTIVSSLAKFGDMFTVGILEKLFKIDTEVKALEKLSSIYTDVDKSIKKLGEKYSEGTESSEQKFKKYLIEQQNKIGSIYEYNLISEIITKQIEKLKGTENSKKETILIIDDLDRLDPEHIFRLLNIFSAHCDVQYYTEKSTPKKHNKFNFDKIIFVCDVENLRSLFHHRYGAEANFVGYLDKFYSGGKIFNYNSRMEMIKYVEENIEHIFTDFEDFVIPWFVKNSPLIGNNHQQTPIHNYHIKQDFIKPCLLDFLKSFIETGELNFRQIQSINRINLDEILNEELSRNDNKLSIIRLLFSVLISISGSAENLKTSFKELADKEPVCDFSKKLDDSSSDPLNSNPNLAMYKILFLLILIDFTLEKFYLTKEDINTFYFCSKNAKFNRKIDPSGHVGIRFTKETQILHLAEKGDIEINYCSVIDNVWNNNPMFKYINYFALMAKVLEDLQAQKLL
jgi:YHS domain-containing protein